MNCLIGVATAEINKQSDEQISRAYQILVVKIRRRSMLTDKYREVDLNRFAMALRPRIGAFNGVFSLLPGSHAYQHVGHFHCIVNPRGPNLTEYISLLNACLCGRTIRLHVEGNDGCTGTSVGLIRGRLRRRVKPVHPGDAILRKVELLLLLEIHNRGDDRRHCENHKQSSD